ncbi:hypothetical protein, conserved [Angomonas deanei]|uniref:Uncharacterized protein n=1 Tax=Angomonas deanei TaxID=59799 RepID=A0A7G2CFQ1_9TRYP|nr:hypothetical protein, conserved [Angomonas deanei]
MNCRTIVLKVTSFVGTILPALYFIAVTVAAAIAKRWLTTGFSGAEAVLSILWIIFHFIITDPFSFLRKPRAATPAERETQPLAATEEQNTSLNWREEEAGVNADPDEEAMNESLLSSIESQSTPDVGNGLFRENSSQAKLKKNPLRSPVLEEPDAAFVFPEKDYTEPPKPKSKRDQSISVISLTNEVLVPSSSKPRRPSFNPRKAWGRPSTASAMMNLPKATIVLNDSNNTEAPVTRERKVPSAVPICMLYVILLWSLSIWGGSVAAGWDTHSLFASVPSLIVPWVWSSLTNLRYFFNRESGVSRFHLNLLRVLLHCATFCIVCVLSLGAFVACVVLELVYKKPYEVDEEPIPLYLKGVTLISPVILFSYLAVSAAGLSAYHYKRIVAQLTWRDAVIAGDNSPSSRSRRSSRKTSVYPGMGSPHEDDRLINVDLDDDSLSSIVRSSFSTIGAFSPRLGNKHGRGVSPSASIQFSNANTPHAKPHGPIGSAPQLKTVTMLYVAFRDVSDGEVTSRPEQNARSIQQQTATTIESLIEALEDTSNTGGPDSNAYILTAHEDAICLVWGLVPFSSDPVCLAVEKARRIFAAFYNRPKPPSSGQHELVAAVVYAPQSLIGLIGTGSFRSIHFYNPSQHLCGSHLLDRGFTLHQCLPSTSTSEENEFHGIMLDSRAAHSSANNILCRPCGVLKEGESANARKRNPMQRALMTKYTCMYDFRSMLNAKEEEWHLVVQRQEELGNKFCFLTEASQQLMQNNAAAAQSVLKTTLEGAKTVDDNIKIAELMLEDIKEVSAK